MSIWTRPCMLDIGSATSGPYRFAQLRRDDIPSLVAHLAAWCPHIRLGALRHYLDPAFYECDTTLAGEADRAAAIYVGWHESEMVFVTSLRIDDSARVLVGEFSAVSPDYPQEDFAPFWSAVVDAQAHAADVAVILTYVTVRDLQRQWDTEQAGFRPVGIIPCSDRTWTAAGARHVSDILYARVLAGPERVDPADDAPMTPAVSRLWTAISRSS